MRLLVDLHIHSNYSDGDYSVNKILNLYKNYGFELISITDHDNLDSQEEAKVGSIDYNIKYIYGIEISTLYKKKSIHILGYFNHIYFKEFCSYIKNTIIKNTIKHYRKKPNEVIMGYFDLKEAIDLIHKYNGFAILAHPGLYKDDVMDLINIIDGMECIHPSHSIYFMEELFDICREKKLYCSGGTDFHKTTDINRINNHIKFYKKYHSYLQPFIKTLLLESK